MPALSTSVWPLVLRREFTAAGYLLAWRLVGAAPEPAVRWLSDRLADVVSDHGRGMEQLRRNLSRVVGPENVTRALVRDAVRSYARYWREAFRLASIVDDPRLHARLDAGVSGRAAFERSLAAGRGVILTLPHSGNWDMAGMWLVANYGRFATVAERVKPEVLFKAFVDFRTSLGFEVIALTGSAVPPYTRLREVLEAGGVVCLLGERDLSGRGVDVSFFGETTTMPAGPAKLAVDTGAALHVVHSWFEGDGWGLSASEPIEVTTVEATTQRVADAFAANIAAHPEDWHLLQPLWPGDRRSKRAK
ncbi:phosphatidylinositol mannoside acyltransferase [Corynebacterium uterequi]|uniref:Lauroyl/myristoyl acyltransferase n=1 Tax=Corynebacterium uterequi TaxID=1072256 RepID=A0A0G3HH45_9CORY|nr:phosphatidylinositol mannoside acyltransferase [Corynebacterium uterequi]AKK11243.1 Lauroyl/myristoyl acyltransferase [Corynebacterium uterequi]